MKESTRKPGIYSVRQPYHNFTFAEYRDDGYWYMFGTNKKFTDRSFSEIESVPTDPEIPF